MNTILAVLIFGAFQLNGTASAAGFPTAYENPDTTIMLENEVLRFVIDPKLGGRIASFVDKRDGVERVMAGRVEGMCFDQFAEQDEPMLSGQWATSRALPYEAAILESGNGRACVKVWRYAVPEEQNVVNENYRDVLIEREFTLDAARPILEVRVRLTNKSTEGRRPAYWMRSGYVLGGSRADERYLRPSRRGIMGGGPDDPASDQMVWDPAYGWTATLDTRTRQGVVWLMDASRLMMFYNCIAAVNGRQIDEFPNKYGVDPLWIWDNASSSAVTAEWYYHKACIPPGETWETTVKLVSLKDVNGISHASEAFVADIGCPEPGARGRVAMTVFPSAQPVRRIEFRAELESLGPDRSIVKLGNAAVDMRQEGPLTISFPKTVDMPRAAVLRCSAEIRDSSGKTSSETFEYIVKTSESPLEYLIDPPELRHDYRPGRTGHSPAGDRRVLFLEGLAFERWGLVEALAEIGATVRESEFYKRRITTGVRYFPVTLEEALRFDLIVMAAVDAHAIGYEGCMILRDYVANGGSLLVLGGLYSWGGGRFDEYGLADLLPLKVTDTFDIERGGTSPVTVDQAAVSDALGEPITSGGDMGAVPWFHRLENNGRVLARIGSNPLVAIRAPGAGRVAAVAATTLGDKDAVEGPFWNRDGWILLRDGLLRWLLDGGD